MPLALNVPVVSAVPPEQAVPEAVLYGCIVAVAPTPVSTVPRAAVIVIDDEAVNTIVLLTSTPATQPIAATPLTVGLAVEQPDAESLKSAQAGRAAVSALRRWPA